MTASPGLGLTASPFVYILVKGGYHFNPLLRLLPTRTGWAEPSETQKPLTFPHIILF